MRTQIISITFALMLIATLTCKMQAQVTIGSDYTPVKAGLLELKTIEATNPTKVTDDANKTSDKGGLVLSRVKLQDVNKLSPFLTDTEATAAVKLKHAGLMVYNIYESPLTVTDPNKIFKLGIYMWDGSRWSMLVREEFRFFHMPSFTLDIAIPGTYTIDLYAQYVKQFARAGVLPADPYPTLVKNPGSTTSFVPNFQRNELDYYITYFDQSLIKNISVTDGGVMTYTVDPTPPMDPYAYLNVVFVVK